MKQLISILLSVLLMASTSGIAYAQHFCSGFEMMATVTLGQEKLSCGMDAAVDDACGDEEAENHSCCDNSYTKVVTDDNFAKASYELDVSDNFIIAFTSVFVLDIVPIAKGTTHEYSTYNPPPLLKDIPVLFETFLI